MVAPCSVQDAKRFVAEHHRHSRAPLMGLFAARLVEDGETIGVGIAGRPIARKLADGYTVEITRVCTLGAENGCSMLYGALCRAAKALGYRRVVTYTLISENGASCKAAGFKAVAESPGRSWNVPSRPRYDTNLFGETITPAEPKVRWERELAA